MSKGLLVIERPEKCKDCPFFNEGYDGNHVWVTNCEMMNKKQIVCGVDIRQSWCPIKPMPERQNGYYDIIVAPYGSGVQKGWNDCVDFLEGKKNG